MQTNTRSTNHWKMAGWMVLACLVPFLALAAIFAFQIPLSTTALIGIVLLCPAMHLLMMRGHGHGGHEQHVESPSATHFHDHNAQEYASADIPRSITLMAPQPNQGNANNR